MYALKKIFTDLASIDSPSGSEKNVATYITYLLNMERIPFKEDSVGNIYGRVHGKGASLLFCVHMDTVSKGARIVPIVKNNYIQSDGNTILGADNKAAIAALLYAFAAYKKMNKTPRCLEFLFTVNEETGGGVNQIPRSWILAKNGLTFDYAEPLGGVILDSPWIKNFTITASGKASHASTPEKGINALLPIISILSQIPIGRLNKYTMVNIGTISGGDAVNIIPSYVCIKGEVRSFQEKSLFSTLRKIKNVALKLQCTKRTNVVWSEDGFCGGYVHQKNDRQIALLKKILLKTCITPRVIRRCSGVSDANILNTWGIKTINLTDGVEHAHTVRERILCSTLEKLSQIMYRCMNEFIII